MRIWIIGYLVILCGCVNSKITTSWKTEPVSAERYNRILIVVVLPEADSLIRKKIETEAARSLSGYGYYAISALSTFGPKGLAAASQEDTYSKLCSNGIDAVMTFALVPEKDDFYPGISQYLRPNSYYYNRMWNYKKMQSGPGFVQAENRYFWETILFDLATLQAIGMLRTYPFFDYQHNETTKNIASVVVNGMIKEKIIQKRKVPLKPF